MHLRKETPLTSDACLAERAWEKAGLPTCPRHLAGGCGFARHATYPRKTPAGMRVTRYDRPMAHEIFSLLPDCLASRFPSDLDDLERVATVVAGCRGVEAAADRLRGDITVPSAVRWIRRRLTLVRALLVLMAGRLPLDLALATLTALTREELSAYLAHRLQLAGATVPPFEATAEEALYAATSDLPRKINLLAHHTLMAATLATAKIATADHLQAGPPKWPDRRALPSRRRGLRWRATRPPRRTRAGRGAGTSRLPPSSCRELRRNTHLAPRLHARSSAHGGQNVRTVDHAGRTEPEKPSSK